MHKDFVGDHFRAAELLGHEVEPEIVSFVRLDLFDSHTRRPVHCLLADRASLHSLRIGI